MDTFTPDKWLALGMVGITYLALIGFLIRKAVKRSRDKDDI